ncbi:MAG: hypothetical protein IT440_01070 [Phycisphaeraceae bacterium]|nr:hypothetical protein [Phycisphaeraceae bacterium]
MLASHDSYRDCARLGHPMTDVLVNLFREAGPDAGFFGAKITGGGCGGTVAVLMRDDAPARRRLNLIRQQYQQQTGRETMLFDGSSPGACLTGPCEWTLST